jgi:hypothetical protein
MDSDRFDRLVRTVGQAPSRRQVLRQLAGIAVAAALARGGGEAAAQACKGTGKACKKHSQCCSGNCVGGTGTGSTAGSAGVCRTACLADNQACASSGDTCCSRGYVCGDDLCVEGGQPFGCCGTEGAACADQCDCCGDLVCPGGICQPPEHG